MSDLVTFLLDRIADDEAVARAAMTRADAAWEDEPRLGQVWTVFNDPDRCIHMPGLRSPLGAHIARFDPARVLVECETKRRIVALHQPRYAVIYRESDRLLADAFDSLTVPTVAHSGPVWPTSESEATLRALALPYADHPEFRAEEWA